MTLLSGRILVEPRLALAQAYTWFFGMLVFGLSMSRAGLEGATRRTDVGNMQYINPDWAAWLNWSAVGGTILLVSVVLLLIVILGTLFISRGEPQHAAPIVTTSPRNAPVWTEQWTLWIGLIVISNIVMWGPVLLQGLNFAGGFWARGVPMP